MKAIEIRKRFFDFFEQRNHTKVASSSLIPAQDPTLLFANAGMNQFKDVFLGTEKRAYDSAVSIQKCVRAGGKHNDLDNVGFTKRHLTFFEMMGNFSFGSYFKKEAITFAWEFLTKEMSIPVENLHASVYLDDDDSYALWRDMIGLPEGKIHRLGAAENFWQMGDVGPCGPCTEIHLDRGPEFGCTDKCDPACDCDRFLEIWNLVFMQYDRQPDGTDKPLSRTGVDTGMGLERLASVLQCKESVFQTDIFAGLIKKIEGITGLQYSAQSADVQAAFHVLADHSRSSSLLISDGCSPSNDGRGYVLRKIIRRAALFAQKLTDKSIFPELSEVIIEEMGAFYPELRQSKKLIFTVLSSEIEKFSSNLVRGKSILETYFIENKETNIIPGKHAFKLYDTFGFPTELIVLMAKERGYSVDMDEFVAHMNKQKEQSGKKGADALSHIDFDGPISSEFTGYDELETESIVTALVADNVPVSQVSAGQECWVIAEKSPFFIVGGGQVPDNGWLVINSNRMKLSTVRYIGSAIAAQVVALDDITVGDTVVSIVDEELRVNAMKNHTATHMLQSALIQVLGKNIKQSGSLVHPDYLRFDFTYHENLTPETVAQVERIVNEKIMANIPVDIEYATMKEAIDRGALAFFGDKYNPEKVRIVDIPDFSTELCGGTHVPATGVIGVCKITEVTALSAGHRRIVAVTGPRALELFQDTFITVTKLRQDFKVTRDQVYDAVCTQASQLRAALSDIKQLKKSVWRAELETWMQDIEVIADVPFLFLHLHDYDNSQLKEMMSTLQSKRNGFYFLISSADNQVRFVASSASSLGVDMKRLGQWLKDEFSLRGGASPTMVQGGGSAYDESMRKKIAAWIKAK